MLTKVFAPTLRDFLYQPVSIETESIPAAIEMQITVKKNMAKNAPAIAATIIPQINCVAINIKKISKLSSYAALFCALKTTGKKMNRNDRKGV